MALVRVGKFSNLALQRTSVHVNLFVHWTSAVNKGDTRMADFLFARFPEPLKAATLAGGPPALSRASMGQPSPFDMPAYVLPERSAAENWEGIATQESVVADRASEHSKRYLLFTTIFASALFVRWYHRQDQIAGAPSGGARARRTDAAGRSRGHALVAAQG